MVDAGLAHRRQGVAADRGPRCRSALWLISFLRLGIGVAGQPLAFMSAPDTVATRSSTLIAAVPLSSSRGAAAEQLFAVHGFCRLTAAPVFFVKPRKNKPTWPEQLKLSALQNSLRALPHHQRRHERARLGANKRGRNADFFMFTPDYRQRSSPCTA